MPRADAGYERGDSSPNRAAARTRRSGDDPAYAIDAGDGRKVTRMSHKDDELVTLQKQSVDSGLL